MISALNLLSARGSLASPTATQSGDVLAEFNFEGFDTARSTGAQIRAQASANWGTSGDTSDSPAKLIFATAADGSDVLVDRLVIASDGNVGIGVAEPAKLLDVALAGSAAIRAFSYGTSVQADLILGHARGTQASPTATQDDDVIGSIQFQGWSTVRTTGAQIRAVSTGVWGQSSEALDTPAELIFSVGNDLVPTVPIDVLILHSNAIVEIPFLLHVGSNSNFAASIEVTDHVTILYNEDRPTVITDPGPVAIVGEDNRISWHDATSGDRLGSIGVNRIETPAEQDWRIEAGSSPILDYKGDGNYIGLNLASVDDDPECALHVTTGPVFVAGMIFDAFIITSGSAHTILSGTGLSANVDVAFHGQAIVKQTFNGSGLQTVTLTVVPGTSQTVFTAAGTDSVTFQVSSGAMTVTRSTGTGFFHIAVMGMFL
jgi:hypothetical protein